MVLFNKLNINIANLRLGKRSPTSTLDVGTIVAKNKENRKPLSIDEMPVIMDKLALTSDFG